MTNWPLFEAFIRQHCILLTTFQGRAAKELPWARWEEFRENMKSGGFPTGHFTVLYRIERH